MPVYGGDGIVGEEGWGDGGGRGLSLHTAPHRTKLCKRYNKIKLLTEKSPKILPGKVFS